MIVLSLLVVTLSACNSKEATEDGTTATTTTYEKAATSESGFVDTLNNYMTAQQDLMIMQANITSQEFEDLSQHAKDVINSSEYEVWVSESKNLANYDLSGFSKKSDYESLQKVVSEYDKVQMDYFTSLAEAKTQEEYNDVNAKLAEDLSNAQESLIDVYNSLTE